MRKHAIKRNQVIRLRTFFLTEAKKSFIREMVEKRDLFMLLMESFGGTEWPRLCVSGEAKNIKAFFEDLKEYFLLPPFYEFY